MKAFFIVLLLVGSTAQAGMSHINKSAETIDIATKFNALLDKLDNSNDLAENNFRSTLGIVGGGQTIENIKTKFNQLLIKLDNSTDLTEENFMSQLGL